MNELMKINYDGDTPTVSGRELHEYLEVGTKYQDWFPRMCEYGFAEGIDFCSNLSESVPSQKRERTYQQTDHLLTIRMAEHLCMIQRTEKGAQARDYFYALGQAWNTPEMVMSRALKLAEAQIKGLQSTNSKLTTENQIMHPKAEYFDALVDRNLLTNFRETAKELGIKERDLVRFMLDHKYIYRDKRGKLMPYAHRNDGIFEIKECFNEKTNWSGTQTLITPKGRETFRSLYLRSA